MGKGSRVVIQAPDRLAVRVLPDRGGLRVLVVDDDADTADSLALLLEIWGYEAWVAYSGPEALEAATSLQPDVMLLDVAMPGLDGFGVARAIRRRPGEGALLVAVTGYADATHRERGELAGFDHYLVKPVEPAAVKAILLAATGGRATPVGEAGAPKRAPEKSGRGETPC